MPQIPRGEVLGSLIQVKALQAASTRIETFCSGRNAMPVDVAITIAAIAVPFVIFAAVLAWGEYQTRHL